MSSRVPISSRLGARQAWHVGFNSAQDLRLLRKAAKLTQAQLAEAAGFSADTVKYWEAAKGRADGVAAKALRQALEARGFEVPKHRDAPYTPPPPPHPPATCGAKTRTGAPCQCRPLPCSRRCKFHGGLSTGPKTQAGRDRIAAAQRARHKTGGAVVLK
jgi:DNA-binding transcriptional regulator YiaG